MIRRFQVADDSDSAPVDVLLVEDDSADVLLIREVFEQYKIRNALYVVGDGEQAMEFVRRTGEFADVPRPGLILLDINLPRRNGLEVLADIKSDGDLRHIPVIMLTTSEADEDVMRSYQHHANAYISKPVDFDRFAEVVRKIDDFFLTLVRLPK
jgi:CheY-like chemotaxis protein